MTRGPEFPPQHQRMETVSVTLRAVRDKAIAVTDGTEKDWTDPKTGEVKKQEQWEWLPRSVISIDGVADVMDTQALERLKGTAIEVTCPERLLSEKGLI